MQKKVIILGASGSIGLQSIDVIKNLNKNNNDFELVGFSVNTSIESAEKIVREFNPIFVAVSNLECAKQLKIKIEDTKTRVLEGKQGIIELCEYPDYDICINGIVGIAGLEPTLKVLESKRDVALANKETIVAAGEIVMKTAKENGVSIIPVDSEHSAVFQCLESGKREYLNKIILTASGGPFFGFSLDDLKNVKKEDALKHPTWNMGAKITIDSATMMNKGLEIIEAAHLFGVSHDNIDVIIHRESIIHSMIEYKDSSIIAQLGTSDMRTPIQYALTYPERKQSPSSFLDFASVSKLTFYKPDIKTFKVLRIAKEALKTGGTAPVLLNTANEIAVNKFLSDEISFTDISDIVEKELNETEIKYNPTLEDIIQEDLRLRRKYKAI